jgi:hypothetical protein
MAVINYYRKKSKFVLNTPQNFVINEESLMPYQFSPHIVLIRDSLCFCSNVNRFDACFEVYFKGKMNEHEIVVLFLIAIPTVV